MLVHIVSKQRALPSENMLATVFSRSSKAGSFD